MLLLRAIWRGFGPYAALATLAWLAVAGVMWGLQLFGKSTWALGVMFAIVAVPLVVLFAAMSGVRGLGAFVTAYSEERRRFREMDAAGRRRVRFQTAGLVVASAAGFFGYIAYDTAERERYSAELDAQRIEEEADEAKLRQARYEYFSGPNGCAVTDRSKRKLPKELRTLDEDEASWKVSYEEMTGRAWRDNCDGSVVKRLPIPKSEIPEQIKRCGGCHVYEEEADNSHLWRTSSGPTLFGVVGRKAGAKKGQFHTKALTQSGIVWTEEKLIAYIVDPKSVVPNPEMAILGHISSSVSESDARAIVDYLKKIK